MEADVWLFDEELYVGHSLSSLTPNRTLNSLYINPLLDILEKQNSISQFHPTSDTRPNGVFDTAPSQTLILLIDVSTWSSTVTYSRWFARVPQSCFQDSAAVLRSFKKCFPSMAASPDSFWLHSVHEEH